MKVVRTTKGEGPAPRPQRGLQAVLYDVVKDCGECTEEEIKYMLPSATDNAKLYMDGKKVHAGLLNAKSSGYLVHEPTKDVWRIAPYSYYQARQEWLNDPERPRQRRLPVPRKQPGAPETVTIFRHDWRVTILAGIAAFLLGFVVGGG